MASRRGSHKKKQSLPLPLAVILLLVIVFASAGGFTGLEQAKRGGQAALGISENTHAQSHHRVILPGGDAYSPAQARTLLENLPVRNSQSGSGYDRDKFGKAWSDIDGNGCDTRNDILQRDLRNITLRSDGCVVLSGQLDDVYTGKQIDFHRGKESSQSVQIDHIVPLYNAWKSGARDLDASKRLALANDPRNLVAVDGGANQEKSAKDASAWLPNNKDVHCSYAIRQIEIKNTYGLWVTQKEKNALEEILEHCE